MRANHEGMNRADKGVIASLVEEISSGAQARLEQEWIGEVVDDGPSPLI
jgi:hypothetical protein